jgi:hypothetical protein
MTDKQTAPEYLARKGQGSMSTEDLATVVKTALSECVSFVDELSDDRAKATRYYKGDPFGNEEEGRSQVVLTEVADAVDAMLPDLMRIAFPPGEHAVEFVPNNASAVEMAEQQTDYVRYVVEQDNAGFLRAMDVVKDGLVRRLGIFKWGWDDSTTKAYRQEGIAAEQLTALAGDPEIEITAASQREDGTFDVDLTRTLKNGRAWVESVPPEEFLYNRSARRIDTAIILAHRTEKTRGELLAMGVKAKDLDEHGGADDASSDLRTNTEAQSRRDGVSGFSEDPDLGEATSKILYTEALMTVDFDGDGIAELRKICSIGGAYWPVSNLPADDINFSVFTPYPEPHTLLGRSVADKTMDMQKINSSIFRGILDSLSLAIFPRMAYLEGQASVADIMNTAIGAPMRERVTGAIRPVIVPFTGAEAIPLLALTQEVIERRTGKPKGAAGLDADALQSTTKSAADAVLAGGQGQMELMARVFCEMALKPLFLGIGRLLAKKQPKARMVRLRGKWVEIDPRQWTQQMDVTVNVALGASQTEKKVQALMAVASEHKEIAQLLGLNNPLVGLGRIRATREKILMLSGIKDVDTHYAPLPLDYQPPPQPPQPDPEQAWIEAEKEMNHKKTMAELAIKADQLQLDREKAEWDHAFQMRKLDADMAIKKYVADVSHEHDVEKAEAELALKGQSQLHDQHLERDSHEHEKAMQEDKQAHEKEMAARAADTADKAATMKKPKA